MNVEEFYNEAMNCPDLADHFQNDKKTKIILAMKQYSNQRVIEELSDALELMEQTHPEYHYEIVENMLKELKNNKKEIEKQ